MIEQILQDMKIIMLIIVYDLILSSCRGNII
jgi:hypothetical protein